MSLSPIGVPYVVATTDGIPGSAKPLSKASVIKEEWLRELLGSHPRLLPVSSVDPRIREDEELVLLGREFLVRTGAIDLLFVSKSGFPVVVETKLFRNPEARRTVVAQVLDYASQLREWGYERLTREWETQYGGKGGLYRHVNPEKPETDAESEWIDSLTENLEHGRMTLLIVGDGIRSEVEQLAQTVNGYPGLEFRLGLVEILTYDMGDGNVLAVPTTLAKTAEIGRTIVKIEHVDGTKPRVNVETEVEADVKRRSLLDEELFFAEMDKKVKPSGLVQARAAAQKLLQILPPELYVAWRKAAFTIRHEFPSLDEKITLAAVTTTGQLQFWKSNFRPPLERALGDAEAANRLMSAHETRLRALGATSHSMDLVELPLSLIAGREEDLVKAILETLAEVGRETEKVASKEDE